MRNNTNWSLLHSGEAFQSLVNTLLQFEFPGIRVFGRAGKDAGQDARSADDKTVYQCKYHLDSSFSRVLSDASNELTKISKYKQPGDPRQVHWKDAQEWVLVTNVLVNPDDVARWDRDVVTDFAEIGLKATLWSLERLEALLTKYPHVAEAFLEGHNRCFLSIGEAYEFTRADIIGESGLKVALIGRDEEICTIDNFLRGTKKVLPIHGPGGIGKSRLLLEAGTKAEAMGNQVLWGLEATMSRSTQWFSSVNYTLPTVLLLDEPQDPDLIRALTELIRTPDSQLKSWRVIISVRSPNDPVLKAMTSLPSNAQETPLALIPLTLEKSRQLALDLIATSSLSGLPQPRKDDIADHLSQMGGRFPIWISIAVNVLAKDGNLANLPHDANGIAKKYVDEVIERSTSPTCTMLELHHVLRWMSIYEELDTEDASLVTFVSKQAMSADENRLLECLNTLVTRKFVVRRGVNQRLYSIKPDVVREFIVRDWLTRADNHITEATPAAKSLVNIIINGFDKKPLPKVQSLIRGLAKTEFSASLQGTQLDLLAPLVCELKRIASEGNVLEQKEILSFLGSFDFARLDDALEIIHTIRLTERPTVVYSDFFGQKHELTHKTVVADLAWTLFNASRYARTPSQCAKVLNEMMDLSIFEAKIPDLFRNDGKRADDLIPRMISGENYRYSGIKAIAYEKAMSLLGLLRDTEVRDVPTLSLAKVLCEPFLSIDQERTSYKQHAFTVTRWYIALDAPDGLNRSAMRAVIRETLEGNTASSKCRLLCWKLLTFAHSSANRALLIKNSNFPPKYIADIIDDLKSDLMWAMELLKTKKPDIEELRTAREIWNWHYKFEKDQQIKKLANECEEYYKSNPVVGLYHVFFSYDMYKEAANKAADIGKQLGTTGTCESISRFLQQAKEFAPIDADFGNFLAIAEHASAEWEHNSELVLFTHMALTSGADDLAYSFALAMLNRRLRILRDSNNLEVLTVELQSASKAAAIPNAQIKLLLGLYSRPHPMVNGILTLADLEFALHQINTVGGVLKPWIKCKILASMHYTNWKIVRSHCDKIFSTASEEDKPKCFVDLLEALHFLDLFRSDFPLFGINKSHFDWLLDLMVTLPDIDEVVECRKYELEKLVERFGRRDLSWLLAVLNSRIQYAASIGTSGENKFKLMPTRHRLTMCVCQIDSTGTTSASVIEQMQAIIGFTERKDMLGYIAPQYAADLDPHGILVPELIALKIDSLNPKHKASIWMWVRFAGYYTFNSSSWRQIAKAAVRACVDLPPRDRNSIFIELLPQGMISSSYPAGEMDPRPERDLLARKLELQEETDADLISFRQWHLGKAQAEFNHAVAQYKEEIEQ